MTGNVVELIGRPIGGFAEGCKEVEPDRSLGHFRVRSCPHEDGSTTVYWPGEYLLNLHRPHHPGTTEQGELTSGSIDWKTVMFKAVPGADGSWTVYQEGKYLNLHGPHYPYNGTGRTNKKFGRWVRHVLRQQQGQSDCMPRQKW